MQVGKTLNFYTRVQPSMGTGLSNLPGKVSSSRIETDPLEEMAESKTRDVTRQLTPVAPISQNDIRRYTSAFQVVQEFLNNGWSMMERQTMLESELETCRERYESDLLVLSTESLFKMVGYD